MLNVVKNGQQLSVDPNGNLNINLAAGSISGGNLAASLTGAVVPTNADYIGLNISGTLVGLTGFSLVNSKPAAVAIVDASGNQVTSFGGGTQYVDGVTQATPTGTVTLGRNGSNILHPLSLDGSGNLNINIAASAGSMSVTQGTSPWVDNISQFGGNAVATGTGTSGVGIPRVTVSNDSNILATQSGTWNIGTVTTLTGITNNVNVNVVNASLAVTGTFWQSTQPVSIATMPSTPVTGTFWQVTQPVSIASMPSTPVTGTFWQVTQPVSIASMPTTPVTGSVTTTSSGTTLIGGLNGLIPFPLSVNAVGGLLVSEYGGIAEMINLLLLETRASRHALMALVCESGKNIPSDFNPGSFQTEIISESVLN